MTHLKQKVFYLLFVDFNEHDANEFLKRDEIPSWLDISFELWDSQLIKDVLNETTLSQVLEKNSVALNQIRNKNAFIIRGEVDNPESPLDNYFEVLAYLSAAIFNDAAIGLIDVYQPASYTKEQWISEINEPLLAGDFEVSYHMGLLSIPEGQDTIWLRTSGMIKFGKPELAAHELPEDLLEYFADVFNYLAAIMILKNYVPDEGEQLEANEQPLGIVASYQGQYNDRNYNGNIHIELSPVTSE